MFDVNSYTYGVWNRVPALPFTQSQLCINAQDWLFESRSSGALFLWGALVTAVLFFLSPIVPLDVTAGAAALVFSAHVLVFAALVIAFWLDVAWIGFKAFVLTPLAILIDVSQAIFFPTPAPIGIAPVPPPPPFYGNPDLLALLGHVGHGDAKVQAAAPLHAQPNLAGDAKVQAAAPLHAQPYPEAILDWVRPAEFVRCEVQDDEFVLPHVGRVVPAVPALAHHEDSPNLRVDMTEDNVLQYLPENHCYGRILVPHIRTRTEEEDAYANHGQLIHKTVYFIQYLVENVTQEIDVTAYICPQALASDDHLPLRAAPTAYELSTLDPVDKLLLTIPVMEDPVIVTYYSGMQTVMDYQSFITLLRNNSKDDHHDLNKISLNDVESVVRYQGLRQEIAALADMLTTHPVPEGCSDDNLWPAIVERALIKDEQADEEAEHGELADADLFCDPITMELLRDPVLVIAYDEIKRTVSAPRVRELSEIIDLYGTKSTNSSVRTIEEFGRQPIVGVYPFVGLTLWMKHFPKKFPSTDAKEDAQLTTTPQVDFDTSKIDFNLIRSLKLWSDATSHLAPKPPTPTISLLRYYWQRLEGTANKSELTLAQIQQFNLDFAKLNEPRTTEARSSQGEPSLSQSLSALHGPRDDRAASCSSEGVDVAASVPVNAYGY